MTEETAIPPVPAEKLVRVYLKMKTAKSDLEVQVKKIDAQMDQVKAALLAYCKEQSLESVRTT